MRMITKQLEELAVSTPYSLSELRTVKYNYHLTDFGVSLLIEPSLMWGVSLNKVANHFDIVEERDRLGEAVFIFKTELGKSLYIPDLLDWLTKKLTKKPD